MIEIKTPENNVYEINPLIMQAVEFTNTYEQFLNHSIAIREAMCLKKQYPALLAEIRKEDLFAGRRSDDRILYVGSIWWGSFPGKSDGSFIAGKQGGYCFDFSAVGRLDSNEKERQILEHLKEYWKDKATIVKTLNAWEEEMKQRIHSDGHISAYNIGFSIAVDLDRLLQKGIPGLLEDVKSKQQAAEKSNEDTSFYTGLLIALEVFVDACRFYVKQALELAEKSDTPTERQRLEEIARTLEHIIVRPPQSFREAIQLVWMYILISGGKHLEAWAFDVALGDFYAKDIDLGVINEEQGIEMLVSLWRLFNENGEAATCRIGIGGKGRRNETNADKVALIAMEASKRHKRVTPQLMLRFYKGQNPRLMHKAYDTISESYTYPMLYNDDVIIPGVAKIFGISNKMAERYHPLGCGEYMLGACSPSLLDSNWNVPKALEAALHNGNNSDGLSIGPGTGTLESFDTFEKLYAAFLKQIEYAAELSAKVYKRVVEALKKECCFLYASLLTDDCLDKGCPALDGGMKYIGGCAMGHGFTNAADSLTAIKKLVYREKRFTLNQLVTILDNNFEGQETVRKMLLDAPKFGNNNDEADQMLVEMWKKINLAASEAGNRAGLDFHIVSSVNPGGHGMGFRNSATADSRRKGESFAIGNAPTAGFDRNGLTALFNSLVKVDPANGGAVTNFKISREFFTEQRSKLEALFGTFFVKGGMQATITVVNKDDLEAALTEPEKYPHVLVRLGGWTARFIDLEPKIQGEIIRRTLY